MNRKKGVVSSKQREEVDADRRNYGRVCLRRWRAQRKV